MHVRCIIWASSGFYGQDVFYRQSRVEVEAEIARYIEATGNCPNCFGTKEEFLSWSVAEGTKRRTCSVCGGSGRSGAATQVTKGSQVG